LLWGVIITAFDVMLFLLLQSFGIRKIEALILTLIGTIGACFAVEMFISHPPLIPILHGFIPGRLSGGMLYIAIGIIGATVMPHNLYLHSALVQSRAFENSARGVREATRFNLVDSVVALNAAFFVNAAILVLAASAFYTNGHHEVGSLQEAHKLLAPLLGTTLAPILFAVALLASGQSSTVTGTIAGQIVMEGFVRLHMRPWLRRLVTRLLAITPAVIVISLQGDQAVDSLLILSQVVLSLQLSFAVVPLIHFTSDRRKMSIFVTPLWARVLAWGVAAIIIALNAKLVYATIGEGLRTGNLIVRYFLLPATAGLVPLLGWMIVEPVWRVWLEKRRAPVPTPELPPLETVLSRQFRRIGIALEVSASDQEILASVVPLARVAGAEVVLIHAVESATARFIGPSVLDEEARGDTEYLERAAARLREGGILCTVRVGAGEPENEIARIAHEEDLDLIVTGSHGHKFFGDLIHGSTVTELRHKTKIPVLTIRLGQAGG
jgi:manganese transport protein